MAFKTRRDVVVIQILCSMLSVFTAAYGIESDILCLRSIKDSLEDQHGYLASSWNFNNKTEGAICRFNGVECWHPDESRVLSLRLSNMNLKGQFPRGLQNCSSLTGLDLSNNQLSGPIPSDISVLLTFATTVDLSYNKFSGEIPAALAGLVYLNVLKLDNNMLHGQIPQELGKLQRIRSFNVSNNHLSGLVPLFSISSDEISTESYANNNGLCGGPLEPCTKDCFHQSFKNGVIVGYAFSVTLFILVYMSLKIYAPWTHLKNKKKNRRNKAKELGMYMISITRRKIRMIANQIHQLVPLQFVEKGSKEISVLLERLTSTIRFEEINDATNCFTMDNAIGLGKMGIMYEGKLPNGQYLAVKRILDSQLFNRQLFSEITILGKYKHRNIMPLIGFCKERMERILVYPYMSNGRLSKWLHPLESEAMMKLGWPERVGIALGLARGLSWLHHSCDLHIVHNNICSESILLDENFEPKISNFGEAKFMNPKIGHDLGMMFKVDDGKKDVYDFGSVLFELITGKTYNELSSSFSTADLCDNPSNFCDAIDKFLVGKGFENEVFKLIKIACECVQPLPDQRPTMLQVYNNMSTLTNIWEEQHGFCDDSYTPRQSEIALAISTDEIVQLE